MTLLDQLMIRAASTQINLINYVVTHPNEPVPTDVIRASIDAATELSFHQIADVLQSATCSSASASAVPIAGTLETDPSPDKAA